MTMTFQAALDLLPTGYSMGWFHGRSYGVTVSRSLDGKRVTLFARELGGQDIVSFNLYRLEDGDALRPCEMSSQKVSDFVLGFELRPAQVSVPKDVPQV
jgi:hypothetical protein